jgi:hypothetical protein
MKYEFANGNTTQKGMWEEAISHLLHLPQDALPLTINVSFVDPSTLVGGGHLIDLAVTTWTYGSTEAETKVRNDSPGFGEARQSLEAEAAGLGLVFNPERFYLETAIHELGHAAFASLPESKRIAIAQMFGAQSDDLGELDPSGAGWQDKIIEGIAETFKEAFLPRRFRVFPNRTKRKIPYHEYPRFRELFRQAVPEIGSEEEGVPGYNFNIFRRGGYGMSVLWPDERGGLYTGKTGGGSNFESISTMQVGGDPVQVQGKHKFTMAWTIPRSVLEQIIIEKFLTEADLRITLEALVGEDVLARWSILLSCGWVGEFERAELEKHPDFQGITQSRPPGPEGGETEYLMWFGSVGTTTNGPQVNAPTITGGTGLGGLLPALTIHSEFESDWLKEELQLLEIIGTLKLTFAGTIKESEVFIASLRETIPDFHFHQGGVTPGEGGVIELPSALLVPEGSVAGSKPHRRHVAGSYGR